GQSSSSHTAIICPHPRPRAFWATYNAPSIPAESPPQVTILPLSTNRLPATTLAVGTSRRNPSIPPAVVVTSLPSSKPAFARKPVPLQTDMTISASLAVFWIHLITSGFLRAWSTPPPGNTRISIFGWLSNQYFGLIVRLPAVSIARSVAATVNTLKYEWFAAEAFRNTS